MNNGEVYAVFSYEAQQSDELSFEVNDQLIILRKGDDAEREWWWAKMKATGKEGYVPRNLLGVCTLYIVDNLSVCVFFFPVSCNKTRKVIFNTYLILIYFRHFMFIIFFFKFIFSCTHAFHCNNHLNNDCGNLGLDIRMKMERLKNIIFLNLFDQSPHSIIQQ